ncbi:MAG: EscU/YscU/HrcU family type III secretion system export apparatus switch protein, partial [Bdellovibrionales bacterium]|nr:EscU/YscU/HrcU family type III secretion system export apparatus switch protein [Bdellovibrionales bacterium]
MADEDDNSERTEDPTPQRREDFRKKGQVAQSRELSSVLVLLISLLAMWLLGRFFLQQLSDVFTRSFTEYAVTSSRHEDWFMAIKFAATKSAMIVLPLGILLWVVNVASTVLQIGFLASEEVLKFDLNKLDPVAGFKKILSLRAVVEGAKAIIKMSLVSSIVYVIISNEVLIVPQLINYDV